MPCAKGMTGCHRACAHRQLVMEYRDARHAYELAREAATCGYATETRDYHRDRPPLTFKVWLEAFAGRRDQDAA